MKKIIVLFLLALTSCGYSSRDNELIGQVKKVVANTPIFCPDYNDVDISLGVMRNGVGSMSSEDNWMLVTDADSLKILKQANESGELVKIVYDVQRFRLCVPQRVVKKVQLVK